MARAGKDGARPGVAEAPRTAVAIMAKAPRAGDVKTRLCPPLCTHEAADLYRCFLLDKIEQVRGLGGASPVIAYTPADGRAFFEASAPGFVLLAQQGADLGERLANTFEALFSAGHTTALLIDSDTPTLPTAFLVQALDVIATATADVVLGPSEDGGYYLIGLRKLYRELFAAMRWSTAQVLADTVQRCRALGLTVTTIPSWFDIDTPDDLARLRTSLAMAPEHPARHTRRFLTERTR
jgi:uncharacterized protein